MYVIWICLDSNLFSKVLSGSSGISGCRTCGLADCGLGGLGLREKKNHSRFIENKRVEGKEERDVLVTLEITHICFFEGSSVGISINHHPSHLALLRVSNAKQFQFPSNPACLH